MASFRRVKTVKRAEQYPYPSARAQFLNLRRIPLRLTSSKKLSPSFLGKEGDNHSLMLLCMLTNCCPNSNYDMHAPFICLSSVARRSLAPSFSTSFFTMISKGLTCRLESISSQIQVKIIKITFFKKELLFSGLNLLLHPYYVPL